MGTAFRLGHLRLPDVGLSLSFPSASARGPGGQPCVWPGQEEASRLLPLVQACLPLGNEDNGVIAHPAPRHPEQRWDSRSLGDDLVPLAAGKGEEGGVGKDDEEGGLGELRKV